MQYEVLGISVCFVVLVVILVRISLTLNEISASLRKIAKQRSGERKAPASTILREDAPLPSETGDAGDSEIAVAIAVAHAALANGETAERG
jgi:hypothetical protein